MSAGFANHYYYLYLLFVPILTAWLLHRVRVRARLLDLVGLPDTPEMRLKPFVPWLILIAMAVALSRPYIGVEDLSISSSGRDIFVLFDVSNSMLAKDAAPDRMTAAKRKLLDLLRLVSKRGDDRIALILFAGQSYLFCPATADYGVLRNFINAISADIISDGASNFGSAVESAAASRESAAIEQPLVIMISDGEENHAMVDTIIEKARGARLSINAIGVGTPEGAPIEIGNGRYIRDLNGNIIHSRLNDSFLSALAGQTGGIYRRASLDDSDLLAILERQEASRFRSLEQLQTLREAGPWLLMAILLSLFYFFALGRKSWVLPLLLALSLPQQASRADESSPPRGGAWAAADAYERGQYEQALELFRAAYEKTPGDARVVQGLASSYYRLGKYEEAAKLFYRLSSASRSGRLKYSALYNLGNAHFMTGDFQAAITSYEQALTIKPGDEPATANLKEARARLRKLTPTPTPTPTPDVPPAARPSPPPSPRSSPTPTPTPTPSPAASGASHSSSSSDSAGSSSASSPGNPQEPTQPPVPPTPRPSPQASPSPAGENNQGARDQQGRGEQETAPSGTTPAGTATADSRAAGQTPAPPGGRRNYDPFALKREEARGWLDSQPDSPVLLYDKTRNRYLQNEHRW